MNRLRVARPGPRFAPVYLTAILFAAPSAPAPAQGWNVELVGQTHGRPNPSAQEHGQGHPPTDAARGELM